MSFATARVAPEKAVFRPVLPLASLPGMTEMQMATMTYREQLLHPNWQRKRLEIMQRDDFKCRACGDDELTLHVHHKQYVKGRLAWEYPNDELVTLCEGCHEVAHEEMTQLRAVIAKLPVDGPRSVSDAYGVLAGWAHQSQGLDFAHVFDVDPHAFLIGELAGELEDKLDMDTAMGLLAALQKAPPWVVKRVLAETSQQLVARAGEAPPPRPDGWSEL